MALKALDIFKFLPKTNCGKCGHPTCLAFSMQMAAKKAGLDDCPEVTAEARAALEGASSPPIRLVTIGTGASAVQVGQETVLFRHEESFYHPTGIAVRVADDLADDVLQARVNAINALKFERVGEKIVVNMIAVENTSGDAAKFAHAAAVAKETGLAMILMSENPEAMAAALETCSAAKPLIHQATSGNWEAMAKLAVANNCPLAVDASDLGVAADLTARLAEAGAQDLVLDVTTPSFAQTIQALTKVRRLSLKKAFRPLGYPCLAVANTTDPNLGVAEAGAYIAKYAGVVVVDAVEPWQVLPLLAIRQNIYTDPRKPVQVEPKLYAVGAVNEQSPLLITTNFSLTYYTVEGDVEASRVPCYIGVIDTEGTSVLTAWASEKLTVDKITKFLNSEEVKSRISHGTVIIPGYIAVMSGKLEDESGWKVMVGPRESSGLSRYLKTVWKAE